MIESETRYPGAPMKVYTLAELENIAETHPHPAIRGIAVRMAYAMGKRDQIATSMGNEFGVKL